MVILRRTASSEVFDASSEKIAERKLPKSLGISRNTAEAIAVSSATESSTERSGDEKANSALHSSAEKITATFPIGANSPPISPESE